MTMTLTSEPSDPSGAAPSRCVLHVGATEGAGREVRGELTRFADGFGVPPEVTADMALAVNEAVNNVVRHAYPDGSGDVHVTADVRDGALHVTVADAGQGMRPAAASEGHGHGLGFGLLLMAQLANAVSIEASELGGVAVRLRFLLP